MLHRRTWMAGAGALLAGGCAAPGALPGSALDADDAAEATTALPLSRLTADDGLWMERLSWGANASLAQAILNKGRARWVAEQLRPRWPPRLPPAAQAQIDAMTISQTPVLDIGRRIEAQRKAMETQTDEAGRLAATQAYQQELNRLSREAATRSLLRSLYSPGQLQDQMGWFWFNHFNVNEAKGAVRFLVGDYEDQMKAGALGRFRDLLGQAVFHPAMLVYLDNTQNTASGINENLGRELLELHTLGVDGGYSQADVQAVARVLTGLGISYAEQPPKLKPEHEALYLRRGLMVFDPNRHDFADKQLLGRTLKGGGLAEVESLLDFLAAHPATAQHVCRKLALFWVGDAPSSALVDRLAARFLARDGRIAEVLKLLFEETEFKASLGQRFKDPLHYIYSAVRAGFDGEVIVNSGFVINLLNRLGQGLFARQTPDGFPLESRAWNGGGQLTTRFEVARNLVNNGGNMFKPDPANLAAAAGPASGSSSTMGSSPAASPTPLPQAHPRGELFDALIAPKLSAATRAALAAAKPKDADALWFSSPEFMLR